MNSLVKLLRTEFVARFGSGEEPRVALAPGRVNLIGEHTDYNEGMALPMAIDRHVGVAFRGRTDGRVEVAAPDVGEHCAFLLDELDVSRPRGWAGYVAGVLWALGRAGVKPRGMSLVVQGDLPIGAGLSSSAALEMAVARAACAVTEHPWEPKRMAELAQLAEREYVGVSCGMMDQLASSLAEAGSALLLDCRSLEVEPVPIPPAVVVVVMDTGVRRRLAASGYNRRVEECQEALVRIRAVHPHVRSLRDVDTETLAELNGALGPVLQRRVRHVVEETARPGRLSEALRADDLASAGDLLSASHRSLRDLYEVSSPELDWIVEVATEHPACFGARLTGAGFGGCAIAAVRRDGEAEFMAAVQARYEQRFAHPTRLFSSSPAGGARLVDSGRDCCQPAPGIAPAPPV